MTDAHQIQPPWEKTIGEIYDAVYLAVKAALERKAVVPCSTDEMKAAYILTNPVQIRQLASPSDIQIRTEAHGWVYVLPKQVDEWAKLFNLMGPTEYMEAVGNAIKEGYPVSKEAQKAYAVEVKRQAGKATRKPQLTHTVNENGETIRFDGLEMPQPGEFALLFSNSYRLVIKEVLAFRPYERMWLVSVCENDCQFLVHRKVFDSGMKTWVVYTKE